MLDSKKVAVTGGLSSGKTTVCQILRKLGAYVVSADDVVHQLLSPGSLVAQQVVDQLGPGVLSDNQLDRRKVAELVFSHPEQLQKLEAILHPVVLREIERLYRHANAYPLFVVEIPLLYETKQEDHFDLVVTVLSDEHLCKKRFALRPNTSSRDFEMRMNHQLPPQFKAQKAQFVLFNNGSLEDLETEVKALYSQLIQA